MKANQIGQKTQKLPRERKKSALHPKKQKTKQPSKWQKSKIKIWVQTKLDLDQIPNKNSTWIFRILKENNNEFDLKYAQKNWRKTPKMIRKRISTNIAWTRLNKIEKKRDRKSTRLNSVTSRSRMPSSAWKKKKITKQKKQKTNKKKKKTRTY